MESEEACEDENCTHPECYEEEEEDEDYVLQVRNYLPVLKERIDAYNDARDQTLGLMSFFMVLAALNASPFLFLFTLLPFKAFIISILARDMNERRLRDSKRYLAQIEESAKVDKPEEDGR